MKIKKCGFILWRKICKTFKISKEKNYVKKKDVATNIKAVVCAYAKRNINKKSTSKQSV